MPSVERTDVAHYCSTFAHIPVLTQEEERVATPAQLVRHNLRFVVTVAFKYKAYGFEVLDYIQEGNIGLMRAAEKFEPARGIRFCSYAVWWIKAYIQNYVLRNWSLVKLGTTQAQRSLFFSLRRTCFELERLGVPEELILSRAARRLHVKLDEAKMMQDRLSRRDSSLDTPLKEAASGELEVTFLDQIEDSSDGAEVELTRGRASRALAADVKDALQRLDPRERHIIEQHVMVPEPQTLVALGEHYGFSRERARQLEIRAKDKLRLLLQKVGT